MPKKYQIQTSKLYIYLKKKLNFYKNELTKIISSDTLLKAIANWNSMNFTD